MLSRGASNAHNSHFCGTLGFGERGFFGFFDLANLGFFKAGLSLLLIVLGAYFVKDFGIISILTFR
jgi:hypothetical protein